MTIGPSVNKNKISVIMFLPACVSLTPTSSLKPKLVIESAQCNVEHLLSSFWRPNRDLSVLIVSVVQI